MGHHRKFNRNRRRTQRRHERRQRGESMPPAPFDPHSAFDAQGTIAPRAPSDGSFVVAMSLQDMAPAPFVGFVSSILEAVEAEGTRRNAMRQFLERVGEDPSPTGHALLIGAAVMAPRADDRMHAKRLLDLRPDTDAHGLPDWFSGLESATAVKAIVHHELWWDSSILVVELRLGAGQSLCVVADIGHVDRYIVTKGHLYPDSIEAFIDEFPELMMTPGTWTDYVDIGRAGAQLAEAVRRSDETDMREVFIEDDWRPMRAELLWAARLAMAAGSFDGPSASEGDAGSFEGSSAGEDDAGSFDGPSASEGVIDPLFDPDRAEMSPAEVADVVDAFRHSPHGRRAAADGVDCGIDLLVAYATTAGHARLECWGPRRAAMFLHSYVLGEIWNADIDLTTMPRLLEHWIRFTNERASMPEDMAIETIERIHDVTPIYHALLRAREDTVLAAAQDLVASRFGD